MDFERTYSESSPWESKIGYCRALRAGNLLYITGTTSLDDNGRVHAPGDGYEQAKRCLELIERALTTMRAERRHIVRTRMFVTDITRWAEFGKAHKEFFDKHPPTTTMIQVSRLIDPAMLIEIEADGIF